MRKSSAQVWCNEEDHLRIISMQSGGNVGEVLGRLIKGVNLIMKQVSVSTRSMHKHFVHRCRSRAMTVLAG